MYQITITNQTGHDVQLNGYEVAQFSASGKQVNLDVFTDQKYGSSGQLMNIQYIAPGQAVSGEDDTGVWAPRASWLDGTSQPSHSADGTIHWLASWPRPRTRHVHV